jgi:hypothetical protein
LHNYADICSSSIHWSNLVGYLSSKKCLACKNEQLEIHANMSFCISHGFWDLACPLGQWSLGLDSTFVVHPSYSKLSSLNSPLYLDPYWTSGRNSIPKEPILNSSKMWWNYVTSATSS